MTVIVQSRSVRLEPTQPKSAVCRPDRSLASTIRSTPSRVSVLRSRGRNAELLAGLLRPGPQDADDRPIPATGADHARFAGHPQVVDGQRALVGQLDRAADVLIQREVERRLGLAVGHLGDATHHHEGTLGAVRTDGSGPIRAGGVGIP